MVNDEIINSTIKRMLEAEIDDSTIISTLKDIGMTEESSRARIESVRSSNNNSVSNNNSSESFDNSDSDSNNDNSVDSDSNDDNSDSNVVDSDARELDDITKQNDRDFQEREIKEVNEKIENLEKKTVLASTTSVIPKEFLDKISDLSAQNNALMRLMKDVLEVNRKILTELESKK